ncbi:hypothetical protein RFI_21395, partial [Reticulomyxa filosa]
EPLEKEPRNILTCKLDTLTLNYNAECILHLVMFFKSVQKITDLAEERMPHQRSLSASLSHETKKKEKDSSVSLKVMYRFQQLNIRLNKPHRLRHVAQLGLAETNIGFCLYGDYSYVLQGEIGNLTAVDLTNEGSEGSSLRTKPPTILGLIDTADESSTASPATSRAKTNKVLLTFSYQVALFDTVKWRYRTQLKASISSMRFVYHQQLVMEIMDYIQSGMLGLMSTPFQREASTSLPLSPTGSSASSNSSSKSLQSKSESIQRSEGEVASAPDMETAIRYSITINKPVIAFPLHRHSENTIDLDLGSIRITNQVRMHSVATLRNIDLEQFGIELISGSGPGSESVSSQILVEDISIQMEHVQLSGSQNRQLQMVEMSIDTKVTRGLSLTKVLEPNYQIAIKINEFRICISQQHCKDTISMLFGNIWAENPPLASQQVSPRAFNELTALQTPEAKRFAMSSKDPKRDTLEQIIQQINTTIQGKSSRQIQKYENEIRSQRKERQSAIVRSASEKGDMDVGKAAKERLPRSTSLQELRGSVVVVDTTPPSFATASAMPINLFLSKDMQDEFRALHIVVTELMIVRVQFQRILWNMENPSYKQARLSMTDGTLHIYNIPCYLILFMPFL